MSALFSFEGRVLQILGARSTKFTTMSVLCMEFYSCHQYGAYKFEVVPRFARMKGR